MQDDVRGERVAVARRHSSQQKSIGSSIGMLKQRVTETTSQEGEKEMKSLLQQASPPIHWNPTTFSNITKLNLPECGLSSLPSSLGTWLPNLSILFAPKNKFQELPAVIGSCPNLQMVSFKSNDMTSIHPDALQPQLRWLILTDNALEAIPSTIGRCSKLQKLMLSGNNLQTLPNEIRNCHNLELIRLASNNMTQPPMALLQLPNLSWIALSDNPIVQDCMKQISLNNSLPVLDNVVEHDLLGQGASGVTRRGATCNTNGKREVAVKTYNGSMTSDGNPLQERTLALAASSLSSPCLIQVLGQTTKGSLVMELLENYKALAGPPSMKTCSRDTYQEDDIVNAQQAVTMVSGLLDALVKLHEKGICHGDFYGHNVLVCQDGDKSKVRLSDFGAAFAYDRNAEYGRCVEQIEMRAFAHLLDEIEKLLDVEEETEELRSALTKLAEACRQDSFTFSKVQDLWQSKAVYLEV